MIPGYQCSAMLLKAEDQPKRRVYGTLHVCIPSSTGFTGLSDIVDDGRWDDHFELLNFHDRAISFASLSVLSEPEEDTSLIRIASICRSSSASRADRSRDRVGSRPRARSASSRRALDTASLGRVIGTACPREVLWRRLSCARAGSGPSGMSRRGFSGTTGRIRSLSVNMYKKDLGRLSLGSFIRLCFARVLEGELHDHETNRTGYVVV